MILINDAFGLNKQMTVQVFKSDGEFGDLEPMVYVEIQTVHGLVNINVSAAQLAAALADA